MKSELLRVANTFDSRSVGLGVCCVLLCATAAIAATPQGAREAISAADLRRHIAFLASDTLEGRKAGSQGGRAAAAYLTQQLREAGLEPGADDGDFRQPFGPGHQNVLALLPGSDPDLRDEVIVISGHYDHVGFGSKTNSFGPIGQIHNGADDNASGTAAVVEVARAMASLDTPARRSILFALWDNEEAGMLGSKYWLKHPTVPVEHVRLMVNVDMIGRLRNDTLVVYGSRSAAGLRQRLVESNTQTAIGFQFDWTQRDDSDHWPFYRRGVPYLMLHTGDHSDYHRPSDDVEKLNYEGLERLSQMMFELTRHAANADELPALRSASYRERRWHQQQADKLPPAKLPRLGLSWSAARKPGAPFTVTRIIPGSAAAVAQIQPGDRITAFAAVDASQIDDLAQLVLAAPSQTTVTFSRASESPVTRPLTLRGGPARIGVTWRGDAAEPGIAIVTHVTPGSPAANAGITPLDRLLPPRHSTANSTDWLIETVKSATDAVTLRRERKGRIEKVVMTPNRPLGP